MLFRSDINIGSNSNYNIKESNNNSNDNIHYKTDQYVHNPRYSPKQAKSAKRLTEASLTHRQASNNHLICVNLHRTNYLRMTNLID